MIPRLNDKPTIATEPDETLIRQQYHSLTRIVPVIYVVVIIATVFISLAFSGAAPAWLIVGMPSAILFVVALRLIYWMKSRATVDHKDIDRIRRDIRITEIVGPSIALSFMLIGIGMRMFVDTYQQSLAVVLIWITAVICAFGLAALPTISKRVVLSAGLPLTVSYLWSSNDVMMLLGGLFAVTTCLVIYMLDQNYAAFRTIVNSRATATELAYTDFLTNLANRRYFEFLLTERVSDPALLNKPFAVGIIDLDGFKPVNDVHGHRAGDGVLIETAARLEAFMKGRGKAARMGGDEFAVLVEGVSCENDAIAFANEMRQIFASPFPVQDIAVQLSCSCGFSIYPNSGTDADRLIDQADMALYESKALERGSASVFTASYQDSAMERAKLEQRLRLAVAASDMTVHFQPIIDLSSMRVTGFEALARWYDRELGHISPAIFIPVAEQAGLIEKS
jgi:diguanylate cyclase (GGDEF)-like protein